MFKGEKYEQIYKGDIYIVGTYAWIMNEGWNDAKWLILVAMTLPHEFGLLDEPYQDMRT